MPESTTNAENYQNNRPENKPQVQVDDSRTNASYANFCRVTGTPEEIIIDFGLNTQASPSANQPIVATDRIVMNIYSAKRLLFALQAAIVRHEEVFGTLEIDIQKRVAKRENENG